MADQNQNREGVLPKGPWDHIANELAAEARHLDAICFSQDLAFREAQQEAYAIWCAWEEEADQEAGIESGPA